MRTLDAQLAMLRMQKAQGARVDRAIANTLIAMLKDAYAHGDITLETLERGVQRVLDGETPAPTLERPSLTLDRLIRP